jgi:hypothetical protein
MDIIFGTVNTGDRTANIARQEQGACCFTSRSLFHHCNSMTRTTGISNTVTYDGSNDAADADSIDNKSDNHWQLAKTP